MKLVELEGLESFNGKMRYVFVNPDHVVMVSASYQHDGCSTVLLVTGDKKIVRGRFDVVAEQLLDDYGAGSGPEMVKQMG